MDKKTFENKFLPIAGTVVMLSVVIDARLGMVLGFLGILAMVLVSRKVKTNG